MWKLILTNNLRSVSFSSTERLTNKLVPNLKDGTVTSPFLFYDFLIEMLLEFKFYGFQFYE